MHRPPALAVSRSAIHSSLVLALSAAALASASDPPLPGGTEPALAPEILLESTAGERVSLHAERPGRIATAVVFLDEGCATSAKYAETVNSLAEEYSDLGVHFLVVDSTAGTDRARAEGFAKEHGLGVPVLLDPMLAAAKRFEVDRCATAVLADAELRVVYRGAIDDRFSEAGEKPHASAEWLVEAIEATLAGEEVAAPRTDPAGAPLDETALAEVTFHEHVAPILHAQCAECHHQGQVGPMELVDYDDAKGWAPMMAEVTGNGRMPPWHADPRYGTFENERRLTETEKAILARWAETGAKPGSASRGRKAPDFEDDGWAMGEPDLVFELPEPQEIPAEGVVPYRYVLVDPQIQEDLWVQAAELRPTSTETTHHVLALYVPPGQAPFAAISGLDDGRLIGAGYFTVFVPGGRPNLYPAGMGKKIEKGAKFVFQLHYTPNGKAAQDRTRLGVKLCAQPPEHEVQTRGVFSIKLSIPPNDPRYVTTASHAFRKPTLLISMFPHMHMRGAAFRFERISEGEDGEQRTILCDVPKYDFNWQNFYRPAEPPRFEAGDRIFCTAAYDNSTANPFNPDPNRRVSWGDQTFEEMMIGYIDYVELER